MNTLPTIGFIGLGDMGNPMARNLLAAGYPLMVFDLQADRLAAVVAAGATAAPDIATLVAQSAVIATSLPSSSAFVQVAEQDLLPYVHHGQIIIDFGTVTPPETKRLAARFAEKGVALLDVPLSGGAVGAERAQLYMFVGGDPAIVARCRPILETIGGTEHLTYCGPAGSGQVVKGVNQLMMGIVEAAYLETLAFGVNSGIDIEILTQALGNEGRWRRDLHQTAQRIAKGDALNIGVKFRELPYFLEAAEKAGFPLPITEVVHTFCDQGERVTVDDHRQAPSYWHELTKQRA